MTTLLAVYLASTYRAPASEKYKVDHCYSDSSEFRPNLVRILKVGEREYQYEVNTELGWYGTFENGIETINSVYTKEVKCAI